MTIEDMDLSIRTYNCLKHSGVNFSEQLTNLTDDELGSKIRNISAAGIKELREKLGAGKTNYNKFASSPELLGKFLAKLMENAKPWDHLKTPEEWTTWLNNIADDPGESSNESKSAAGVLNDDNSKECNVSYVDIAAAKEKMECKCGTCFYENKFTYEFPCSICARRLEGQGVIDCYSKAIEKGDE